MIAAALLLVQAAAGTPQSFSILADPCPTSGESEVVVCGRAPERLPTIDPSLAPVDRAGSPCTASFTGCFVGVDPIAPVKMIARAVGDAVKRAKPVDRSGRVPIDLDAPPPSLAGRVGR